MSSDQSDGESGMPIAAAAARFRTALLGETRSATLVQLFDYLLDRSADARAPKEIEIAMAVFGKSGTFDTSKNSMVRGHMHRLRQRLDGFNQERSGSRLKIPKGEYRVVLSDRPEDMAEDMRPFSEPASSPAGTRVWRAMAVAAVASTLFWAALFPSGQVRHIPPSLGQTAFWEPIAEHERLPVIAAGDFFLVVQSGPESKVQRLVVHPMIRSGRELDNYLATHPDQYGELHDRDLHRVPAVVATGAAAILPLVSAMRSDQGIPDIIPVSQLAQERVASSNIIYIEHFPQLGMLRSPVLQMSGFAPGERFDEMKDIASGKVFKAYPAASADAPNAAPPAVQSYGYDYGYIASYPGPSGNRILVISGIEDAALSQMIKLVSDKRQLDLLAQRTRGANAFEALYQVRTVGGLIFDTNMLIVRSLKAEESVSAPR
jgi:hypothetical protein